MVAALQTQVGCVGRCLPAAAWHRQDAVLATFARQAASQLKCVAAGLACLCTQVEGYERSRMALAKSFFENKMRSDAAKVGGLLWSGWRSFRQCFRSTDACQEVGIRRKFAAWKAATLCLICGVTPRPSADDPAALAAVPPAPHPPAADGGLPGAGEVGCGHLQVFAAGKGAFPSSPPTLFPLVSCQLPQALNSAKATISSLAQQQRELEQRRRANLAFSGQTLVGDNLNVLQVGGWAGGICSAGGRWAGKLGAQQADHLSLLQVGPAAAWGSLARHCASNGCCASSNPHTC